MLLMLVTRHGMLLNVSVGDMTRHGMLLNVSVGDLTCHGMLLNVSVGDMTRDVDLSRYVVEC